MAGEEEVRSVRRDVAGPGKKNAQIPFLPCVPELFSENRGLGRNGFGRKKMIPH